VRHEVDRERVRPDRQILQPPRLLDHRPHHLAAGGVAERMDDAMMAMPPLAAELQAAVGGVEPRAPGDQFGDPPRRFADDRIDHVLVAQPAAGGERVGHVVVEAVLRIDDARDAALRPLARRRLQIVFRHDGHRQPGIDCQRRPQPGQAAAQDEHVGEAVRHPLGTECDQVTRPLERLIHSPSVPCR